MHTRVFISLSVLSSILFTVAVVFLTLGEVRFHWRGIHWRVHHPGGGMLVLDNAPHVNDEIIGARQQAVRDTKVTQERVLAAIASARQKMPAISIENPLEERAEILKAGAMAQADAPGIRLCHRTGF